MKNILILFLLFPLILFAEREKKEEIFNDLALSVESADFVESLNLTEYWNMSFPEDNIHAQACASLFLLTNGKNKEALEIFNNIKDCLDGNVTPQVKNYYFRVFSAILQDDQMLSIEDLYAFKWRGWKVKGVLGAVLYTVGLFVAPFCPPAGISIMTTASGYIIDSALGYMDEADDRKKEGSPQEQSASISFRNCWQNNAPYSKWLIAQ